MCQPKQPSLSSMGCTKMGEMGGMGGNRHILIPQLPCPPRSKPVAIPKGLTTRRRGRMMSIGWQSDLKDTPELPEPLTPRLRDEPVFIFPSLGRLQGGEWKWPGNKGKEGGGKMA